MRQAIGAFNCSERKETIETGVLRAVLHVNKEEETESQELQLHDQTMLNEDCHREEMKLDRKGDLLKNFHFHSSTSASHSLDIERTHLPLVYFSSWP